MSTRIEPVTAFALREWALPSASGTKRSRGQALVVGGGPTMPGAAMLAGLAALRVGAGVLSLAVAQSTAAHVAVAVPEASVAPLPELDGLSPTNALVDSSDKADAILVGPGLDQPDRTGLVLATVLEHVGHRALVLDAFALGVLPDVLEHHALPELVVLTPNSAEASYLLGCDERELEDRPDDEVPRELADRYHATVTYSGVVAAPDGRTWTVPTGHAGLGTSGSGDVLAGAVAGLLARGADPAQAACWATYLHGVAGDRLAARVGRLGFLARELVDELPLVIVQTEA